MKLRCRAHARNDATHDAGSRRLRSRFVRSGSAASRLSFWSVTFAKISKILKAVDACLVTVAPAKIQRVTADNAQIANLDFVGYRLRLQRSLPRPFVYALSARTRASQRNGRILAHPPVRPGNSQTTVAFLRNLGRLNCLSSRCCINHYCSLLTAY